MTDAGAAPSPSETPRRRERGGRLGTVGCLLGITMVLTVGLALSLFLNLVLFAVAGGEATAGRKYRETFLYGEGPDKVAVIRLEGIIMGGTGPGIFGSAANTVERIKEQLHQAVDDPKVKAVILEINSPGGSVTASDILHREVKRTREQGKKVVILMGDLCASGGYYVSVGAEKIYAHPTSLTGSIGAIIGTLDLSGLMERFGVRETVVKSGPIKDILSSSRPMTKEERLILQGIVDGAYDRFVGLVKEGRSLSEDELGDSTDGRIFLAPEAKRRGLIDEMGYLEDAVEGAKALAGIPKARVVRYRKEPSLAEVMFGARAEKGGAGPGLAIPVKLPDVAPRLMYLYQPGS